MCQAQQLRPSCSNKATWLNCKHVNSSTSLPTGFITNRPCYNRKRGQYNQQHNTAPCPASGRTVLCTLPIPAVSLPWLVSNRKPQRVEVTLSMSETISFADYTRWRAFRFVCRSQDTLWMSPARIHHPSARRWCGKRPAPHPAGNQAITAATATVNAALRPQLGLLNITVPKHCLCHVNIL